MALNAALAVVGILAKLSSLATETKENIEEDWYRASNDREEFLNLEKDLKLKIEDWEGALRSAGISDDKCITNPLNNAIKCLEHEKEKMDSVQSNCCPYRFKFMSIFRAQPFPSHLKDNMKKVVDAFDNIPDAYKARTEAARMLEPLANNRVEPYQIFVDRRIIKLADTQNKVMQHLNDKQGIKW